MADNDKSHDKKPVISHVPAILTGSAALIAALTTVYINVRGDKQADTKQATVVTAAVDPVAAPVSDKLRLQVERIVVQHDGSPGTTDWRFTVEADNEPLFSFEQEDLDDTGGRNVAVPESAGSALQIAAAQQAKIVVRGWRGSWFKLGADADAIGEGWLSSSGNIAAIRVQAQEQDAGEFVFYFSAEHEAR